MLTPLISSSPSFGFGPFFASIAATTGTPADTLFSTLSVTVTPTFALAALAAVACLSAAAEGIAHRRRLRRIPIRIHVNGTRGKSSVTRLIAAGLRAGGHRTCAKTTGTDAVMIMPDGTEYPIHRPGRANITEQKRVVRTAVECGADALVIECMALQPLLQSTCELGFVRATHGVITNARADHLDVMGPTRLHVAHALAGTTPCGGVLLTAEDREDSLTVLRESAADRGSTFRAINADDARAITAEDLAGFSYLEHAENVALALAVCESVGIDRDVALRGMWAATPDIGAMKVHNTAVGQTSSWSFTNALAANDPESTQRIWDAVGSRATAATRVLLMNCRDDRVERSVSMATHAANWSGVDMHVVIGSGTEHYRRALKRGGVPESRIVVAESGDPESIAQAMFVAGLGRDLDIVGVGNIKGPGLKLAEFFATHDRWPDVAEDRQVRVADRFETAAAGHRDRETVGS